MSRSITSNLQSLTRPDVTYSFSTEPDQHVTVVTVPPKSAWSSGSHWHLAHTEFLKVKSGSALITLGTFTRSVTASSGPIAIERGVIHEWHRDPSDDALLVVEESTDPADGQKELFFRNLSSALLDMTAIPSRAPPPLGVPLGWWVNLQLLVIFKAFDNYPVLRPGLVGTFPTYSVLNTAAVLGLLLGVRAAYEEYTPANRLSKEKGD